MNKLIYSGKTTLTPEEIVYWVELWFKGTVTMTIKKGSDNHSPKSSML